MIDEKTTRSLERKTKKELIEIILRKDSVERDLRETNKNLIEDKKKCENDIENQEKEFVEISNKYNDLNEDYQNCCDENATLICHNKKYKKQRNSLATLLCVMIAMLMFSLIL